MRLLGFYTASAFASCLIAGAQPAAQNSTQFSKPEFENDQVQILERHGQPHDHKLNRVMVYVTDGSEILHYPGGKDVVLKWRAGDVRWSPASGMHTSEITTKNPIKLVDVGIKKAGNPAKVVNSALDALRVYPKDCKLEFESDQVRVIRLKVGPKQSVPMHENFLNRVVVYLTDQNVRETAPDGKTKVTQHKAGEYGLGGPSKHTLDNLSDKPYEAIIVELKD